MPYFIVHLYGPDGSLTHRCDHKHPERSDAETCLARKAAGLHNGRHVVAGGSDIG